MKTVSIAFGEKGKSKSAKAIDRIKSFEDACHELGMDPSGTLKIESSSDHLDEGDLKAAAAFLKLTIIARALNEGWKPDWSDGSQRKWYPWFEWKSGFGFSDSSYVNWNANATVGSRLCFKTEELATYAGQQFIDIYQDFLTFK